MRASPKRWRGWEDRGRLMADDGYRVVLAPRFGGTMESDWYRWLRDKLDAHAKFPLDAFVFCELKPEPEKPEVTACTDHLRDLLGTDAGALGRTIVVGHSLGAQIALRTLADLTGNAKVAGALCVAGWLKLDLAPKTLGAWLREPLDRKAARARAARLINVVSSNDPNQLSILKVTRDWKESELRADVVATAQPGHFSGSEEPLVLETLLDRFR